MSNPDVALEAAARALMERRSQTDFYAVVNGHWKYDHDKELARAAIAAYEKEMWRPIEEADTDVEPVLVTGGARYERDVVCVLADVGWWRSQSGHLSAIPTHFRPLPLPPEVE